MAPPIIVKVYRTPPEALIERLMHHNHHDVPYAALPLVRRLRFTKLPGGLTEHSRILWSSSSFSSFENGEGKEKEKEERETAPFAAAYLDFSRGPETELWIYSSMEGRLLGASVSGSGGKGSESDEGEDEEETATTLALLREVKRLQDLYFTPDRQQQRKYPTTVLVGNLNEVLRKRLLAPEVGVALLSGEVYNKWFFRVDDLPDVQLPEVLVPRVEGDEKNTEKGKGWFWDIVRRDDIPLTISRTQIPRQERTMKLLPSTALYLEDGTPIAWAFLGPDSSLSSLHCEEPYRGKGIAKAVAVRILRDHLKDYGDEGHGYGWADVAPENTQSGGVCRSLGGQVKWQISWSHLDLYKSFPDQ